MPSHPDRVRRQYQDRGPLGTEVDTVTFTAPRSFTYYSIELAEWVHVEHTLDGRRIATITNDPKAK